MLDTQIRVRLTPEIRTQLEEFCWRQSRSLTNAVNVLLAQALAINAGRSREIILDPEVLASIATALRESGGEGSNA
jgi:hypothetical protein